MRKKSIWIVLLSLVFALFLTACGSSSTETTGDETSTSENGGDSEVKVAMILKTLANPFWAEMEEGILEEAEALGVEVDIFAAQSEDDMQGQLRIFEDLLKKDYDGIGFVPLSPVNLIQPVAQAYKDGIPLVNIDTKIDMTELENAGGNVNAFVATDNVEIGRQAAEFIVAQIGGSGQVLIVEGKAGVDSGEARKAGATEVFESTEGIELVASQPADWDRNKALDVVTNMLQRYPDIKGIYAANDTMALGAYQAVVNAGKEGEIVVVGTDGAPEAVESVKNGELTATVAQDSKEMGKVSLRLLLEEIEKGKLPEIGEEPQTVNVPSYIVSPYIVGE